MDLQENSSNATKIISALEACLASLYVLTSSKMPKQVYQEDSIEMIIEEVKHNLMSNVLSFHDARICQIHRPQMLADAGRPFLPDALPEGHCPLWYQWRSISYEQVSADADVDNDVVKGSSKKSKSTAKAALKKSFSR
jgi:hypothetical protein